mgnify:CR=1 FL=1
MPGMATQSLHLRRGQDGYYRTNWYDEAGKRHGRCFGKDRRAARHEFALFHARWRADPAVRNPDRAQPMTIRDGWERYYHWAQAYYVRPDGTPTQEATAMAAACAKLIELYGDLPAREFSPRALRHLQYVAATRIRREYGLEAAQVVLGHARADVTQVYAERDMARAIQVMEEAG